MPILAFLDAHINHGLRIRLPIGAHRGQILLERAQGGQHLQSRDNAVARVVFVHAQNMAAGFAADQPTTLVQLLEHIAVAHFGTAKSYALRLQSQFHRHIGHHRAHHAADGHALFGARFGNHINQAVAIVNLAVFVYHHQAVAVAVKRDAVIGFVLQHGGLQGFRVGGAHFFIDVVAIGLGADSHHMRTQFVKHFRCHMIACAVGGIHHQLEAAQIEMAGESGFAKFDIAVVRAIDAAGAA